MRKLVLYSLIFPLLALVACGYEQTDDHSPKDDNEASAEEIILESVTHPFAVLLAELLYNAEQDIVVNLVDPTGLAWKGC